MNILKNKCQNISWLALLLLVLVVSTSHALEKTPGDVFAQLMVVHKQVEKLRQLSKVDEPWPVVVVQQGKQPRHVLQKSFEVMEKINRLRVIKGLGPTTTPLYPSRKISPNEVYASVYRLTQELSIVLDEGFECKDHLENKKIFGNKTPNDVYQELWSISYAMDPVLGIRGINPNDVYILSLRVLAEIEFLRMGQNDHGYITAPKMSRGKHSNHALAEAYSLLDIIAEADRNLWIEPTLTPELPRRVINSSEVYDALQMVLAELQRIKHRLGVERYFVLPHSVKGKSADDVIHNLRRAQQLMPRFPLTERLVQYDSRSLQKTPNHVISVAWHIQKELLNYKKLLGIRVQPRRVPTLTGLSPKHVYQKTLECLEKVNRLRKIKQLGAIAVPSYPLRTITPTEVYDLATRLDMELEVVYHSAGLTTIPWFDDLSVAYDQTPSDVYTTMWETSYLLDVLLSDEGYTPTDVYVTAATINVDLDIILEKLGVNFVESVIELQEGIIPRQVLEKGRDLLQSLYRVQHRAGIYSPTTPAPPFPEVVTPNDVQNELRLIQAEIITLKVHLGITHQHEISIASTTKQPHDVYRQLELALLKLQVLQEPQVKD